jgi:hypothetical protein
MWAAGPEGWVHLMKKSVYLAHCFAWMVLSTAARAANDPHIA